MSLDYIVKGNYGQTFKIVFTKGGTAQDISDYTTLQECIFETPSGTAKTKSSSFINSGTAGEIGFTIGSSDFDAVGIWAVMGHITGPSKQIYTQKKYFKVIDYIS